MSPRDWENLASVLRAGERKTWGVHGATTAQLGYVLKAMAERCEELAAESAEGI